MSRRRSQPVLEAFEIDAEDGRWLRGETLPEGYELSEVDEVEFLGRTYEESPSGLLLPVGADAVERVIERHRAKAPKPPRPTCIDLFCGAGGFSLGMEQAGFDVVAAVENDFSASTTYLTNLGHPDCKIICASDKDRARWEAELKRAARTRKRDDGIWPDFSKPWIGTAYRSSVRRLGAEGMTAHAPNEYVRDINDPKDYNTEGGCLAFFFGDIAKVNGRSMLEAAGVEHIDVVVGGPPCQGLSTANSKACLEDPRNGLLWEYMRLVTEIAPTTFVIENVGQLLTAGGGALFNALAKLANDAGYDVVAQKLNAAGYGVPQHRVRALVVGSKGECAYNFPMPTSWAIGRPASGKKPWAIGGPGASYVEEMDAGLPPMANYDPATRTWSLPDLPKGKNRGRKKPRAEQLDLTEDAA